MRSLFLLICALFLHAQPRAVDCNKIFEERKSELLKEIERIDEREQAFEALQAATNALLDKKKVYIKAKEADMNATLKKISEKEQNIKDMLEEKKKLLEAIKKAKDDKISETYLKMKDSAAAAIIESMEDSEAAKILFNLTPKKMSKIMAKMDPKKASRITTLLTKGPPFSKNSSKNKKEESKK